MLLKSILSSYRFILLFAKKSFLFIKFHLQNRNKVINITPWSYIYSVAIITIISKIQLVVYYQCCVLIG